MSKSDSEKFVTLDAGINKVTVGTIPLSKLSIRRKNYRKMNREQKETLQASVDKFGFQDLITVVREADGTYGIVDGHHRVEELESRGADKIPVVLLPEGLSKTDADLGMLSFNVSAEIVDVEFSELIKELMGSGADIEEIRKHATISESFMEALQSHLAEPTGGSLDGEDIQSGIGGEKPRKAKKPPQVKLVVILTKDEEDNVVPAFFLTHADTIIGKEVRDVLAGENIDLEEIEPTWFENDANLMEILAEGAGDSPEE